MEDRCINCHCTPKQVLELDCQHTLCLACAHKQIALSQSIVSFIRCRICSLKSRLQRDTILRLIPNKNKAFRISQVQRFPVTSRNCSQHRDELAMYFCYDCYSRCICPECFVQGKHRDHNVMHVKKARILIDQKIMQTAAKIERSQLQILDSKQNIQSEIKMLSELEQIVHQNLDSIFDEIYAVLKEKQRSLHQEIKWVISKSVEAKRQNINKAGAQLALSSELLESLKELIAMQDVDKINLWIQKSGQYDTNFQTVNWSFGSPQAEIQRALNQARQIKLKIN